MKSIVRYGYTVLFGSLLWLAAACGGEESKTGEEPGEVNRENPVVEKQDETGDGFTRESEDASYDAEVGPSPGSDSTNTDSTSVNPRMGI